VFTNIRYCYDYTITHYVSVFVFINGTIRDPAVFRYIARYLRMQPIKSLSRKKRAALIEEALFYQLDGLVRLLYEMTSLQGCSEWTASGGLLDDGQSNTFTLHCADSEYRYKGRSDDHLIDVG